MKHLVALALLIGMTVAPPRAVGFSFSQPGCNDDVLALIEYGGELIAGGRFTLAGGTEVGRIARWDGSAWQPLGQGVTGTQYYWTSLGDTIWIEPNVQALAIYDGELYAGGSFLQAGGAPAACIARWDGASWADVGGGITTGLRIYDHGDSYNFPPSVSALAVWNGELYAGGLFRAAGGMVAEFIAHWDGAAWSTAGYGLQGGRPPTVWALVADTDRLYAGGAFSHADFMPVGNLASWDGHVWAAVDTLGMNDEVRSLMLHGGDLIAGGRFTMAGSAPAAHIARRNGSSWQPLAGGLANTVHSLTEYGGDLYAGAYRWSGADWVNDLQSNGPLHALASFRGRLVGGGAFHIFDGRTCWNVGAWPEDFTAAYLTFFSAFRIDRTAVVSWKVNYVADHLGFHVWRSQPDRQRVRLTDDLLAGRDRYEFVDPDAPREQTQYWLQEVAADGDEAWFGPAVLEAAFGPPHAIVLEQNYPNPFNPMTTLSFSLAQAGPVRLTIHDVYGRMIATLIDRTVPDGRHTVNWDGRNSLGRDVASGIYFARLSSHYGMQTNKLILTR